MPMSQARCCRTTFLSHGRSSWNLPKRTWKAELARVPESHNEYGRGHVTLQTSMYAPSSCSTTMTSIAPLSVAGLMLLYACFTEPKVERTYCISPMLLHEPLGRSKQVGDDDVCGVVVCCGHSSGAVTLAKGRSRECGRRSKGFCGWACGEWCSWGG
jgi:hypothetical protein